jgi:anthranilate phosphoribosyltransferase
MKDILRRLFDMETLSEQEAYALMAEIGSGTQNEAHIAALLTVWMTRPVSLPELKGFRDALLSLALPFDPGMPVLDVCGTGGDGSNTFNISTLTAFTLAGAGYKVAKHGNYGVSSVSGSSTVMEYFGYRFTNDAQTLRDQLEQSNICFLHAPLFHPALKHVGQVRKQLGMKTIFNMLGPLVNPARPDFRLTGVFSLELGRMYHYLMQDSDVRYLVVHSLDGYDEISLTGRVKLFGASMERIFIPEELGFNTIIPSALYGGDTVQEAASVFMRILEGKGAEAQHSAVIANTAAAIRLVEPDLDILSSNEKARESLLSGNALRSFKLLIS